MEHMHMEYNISQLSRDESGRFGALKSDSTDCLLKTTSIKDGKYVVNHKI
jgi:hypothetical protein